MALWPQAFYICTMEFSYRIDDLDGAAAKLWHLVKHSRVIAFDGAMGAGKTTLIHALCRQLGVHEPMGSPTFAIINEYMSRKGPLYHIDLYRCSGAEEASRAGVEDCLYSGSLCFVEWPSRAPSIFPPDTVKVRLTELDPVTRTVTINQAP